MKTTHLILFIGFLAFTIIGCDSDSDGTEISFVKTIDVLRNGNPGLPSAFDDMAVTGFVIRYNLDNVIPITRYVGEIPLASLPAAGDEYGLCNDGTAHLVALDASPDRPLGLTANIIGDTGAEDVSEDNDCKCDSRIDEIAISGFAVYFAGMEEPLQFDDFKIVGKALCPNIADGHLVSGDREFGGAVDIMGAVVLRVAADNSTILADISLSMVESDD